MDICRLARNLGIMAESCQEDKVIVNKAKELLSLAKAKASGLGQVELMLKGSGSAHFELMVLYSHSTFQRVKYAKLQSAWSSHAGREFQLTCLRRVPQV